MPETLFSHRKDPITSLVAGEKAAHTVKKWRERIYDVLKRHDRPSGYTAKEIAYLISGENWYETYIKVSRRLLEMENEGKIRRVGHRTSLIGGGKCEAWRFSKSEV